MKTTILVILCSLVLSKPSFVEDAMTSALFTVEYRPQEVRPVFKAEAERPYYIWTFETRVTNSHPFPIRIVEFGALSYLSSQWKSGQKPFTGEQFSQWYTEGAKTENGWLPAGATAIDGGNWNRGGPILPRAKWFYVAEDAAGNRYRAEREVDLIPYVPEGPNWDAVPFESKALIGFEIGDAQGKPFDYTQIRIRRYAGSTHPYAVYEPEAGRVEIPLPLPGIYVVDIIVPGHQRIEFPLSLAPDLSQATVAITPTSIEVEDSWPSIVFSPEARSANEACDLWWRWSKDREDYFAAYDAHREEHMEIEGFEYDISATVERLWGIVEESPHAELRDLAGILLCETPGAFQGRSLDVIFAMFPPDSYAWATGPQIATNMAQRHDDPDGFLEAVSVQNPDRHTRAQALTTRAYKAKFAKDAELLTGLVDELRTKYGDIDNVARSLEQLSKSEKLVRGQAVPDFDLPTLEHGRRVSSQDLAGNYYLLHFWATWCGPCLMEMEGVHDAYEQFAPMGVQFVSISMDRDRSLLERFRDRKWPLPWANVYAKDAPECEDLFGISSIPALFLVNAEGVIVEESNSLRGEELAKTLANHFSVPSQDSYGGKD